MNAGRDASKVLVTQAAAASAVVLAVAALSFYANLTPLVANPENFRFIPPFEPDVNQNLTAHLGAEYDEIAKSLVLGQGFANPFPGVTTGPTAWMPPLLPTLLAGLRYVNGDDVEAVTVAVVLLQDVALIATGWLVLALAFATTGRTWVGLATYLASLVFYFKLSFQFTHDCWLVVLVVDALVAALVWGHPLAGGVRRAAVWGSFGGLCALVNPASALAWAASCAWTARAPTARRNVAVAFAVAGLVVSPWVARNYAVFHRFIPMKSNAPYELYQSQCLQSDGVLRQPVFATHPYISVAARREYARSGEMAFLDRRAALFSQAVRACPQDFLRRVVDRGVAATLVYVPFAPSDEWRRPTTVWISRIVHPLPFIALLVLLLERRRRPLVHAQRVVIGVYACVLAPYVLISYYERYKFPLLVAEVLFVVWAIDLFVRDARARRAAR